MSTTFRALLTPVSRVQYLLWRLLDSQRTVTLHLTDGRRLVMRARPATDFGVAYEVFVFHCYRHDRLPLASGVRRIVDLGGNVGYTVMEWAARYPAACIDVFEPHPANLAILRANLAANQLTDRVHVHSVAAGTVAGSAILSDNGARSAIGRAATGLTVPVVDLFAELGSDPMDILKLDIEGGEHALLADERFARLSVRALVIEWHNTPAVPNAKQSVRGRLTSAGYEVIDSPQESPDPNIGVLWAFRR